MEIWRLKMAKEENKIAQKQEKTSKKVAKEKGPKKENKLLPLITSAFAIICVLLLFYDIGRNINNEQIRKAEQGLIDE